MTLITIQNDIKIFFEKISFRIVFDSLKVNFKIEPQSEQEEEANHEVEFIQRRQLDDRK